MANMRLLALWGVLAFAVAFLTSPTPWLFLGVGVALGGCAGIIQLRVLRATSAALLAAQTAMDVRRAFSSTRCGRLYLYVFWFSMAVLTFLAISLLRDRAMEGIVAGYSAFAFTRELLTLRGTFELRQLSMEQRR